MSELLEKLSSYNIFNYLLPGVLFAVIGTEITSYELITDNLAIGAFLYYFYGLVISRIGSIAIEPTLKATRLIQFADYSDFIAASRSDSKIEELSEQNNTYRSLASLFLCLLLLASLEQLVLCLNLGKVETSLFGVAGLFVLFVAAYRKQTKYITNRIYSVLRSGTAESKDETNGS